MIKFFTIYDRGGDIIIFALTAMAAMSLSFVVLATSTFLEVRKSANVEKAVFATYKAENTIEQTLFLINKAMQAGKGITDIQNTLNLPDYTGQDTVDCDSSLINCEKLRITLGVNDLPVNLQQNEAITIGIFQMENRDLRPYEDDAYQIHFLYLDWPDDAVEKEIELTFILWNVSGGVKYLPPIRRRVPGTGEIKYVFQNICNDPATDSEAITCLGLGDSFMMGQTNLGMIRIRLLSAEPLLGAILRLCKDNGGACDQKPIPGYLEVRSTASYSFNKQAVRIIQKLGGSKSGSPGTRAGGAFASEIWDYAIFSEKSLSK